MKTRVNESKSVKLLFHTHVMTHVKAATNNCFLTQLIRTINACQFL